MNYKTLIFTLLASVACMSYGIESRSWARWNPWIIASGAFASAGLLSKGLAYYSSNKSKKLDTQVKEIKESHNKNAISQHPYTCATQSKEANLGMKFQARSNNGLFIAPTGDDQLQRYAGINVLPNWHNEATKREVQTKFQAADDAANTLYRESKDALVRSHVLSDFARYCFYGSAACATIGSL